MSSIKGVKAFNATVFKSNGKVGNVRTYTRGGNTYTRVASSEVANPRTTRQMRQRLLFTSKVRLWEVVKDALVNCFAISGAQSFYNIFMKLNNRVGVYYTKSEAEHGAVTAMPLQVASSNGLQTIVNTYNSTAKQLKSNIALGSLVISNTTTIAQLSAAILNANPGRFKENDEICFLSLLQSSWEDNQGNEIPTVSFNYYKVVLSVSDNRVLSGIVSMDGYHTLDGYLATNNNMPAGCFGWLHTRSDNGTILSAESSLCDANSEYYDGWRTDEAFEEAAESYGEISNRFADPYSTNMGSNTEEGGEGTYTITVAVAEGQSAMGSVSGGGSYAEGASAVISAVANDGYHFVKWNDDNTSASRTITVSETATYTATFAADTPSSDVTVTLTSDNEAQGKVQINGGTQGATASVTVPSGTSVTIKAISVAGYDFLKWSDNNQNYERTITPTSDMSLTAYFESEG